MRAAFCTGKETIEIKDTEQPSAAPAEVLVRVRQCGICGTDLHFYRAELPPNPMSIGHEFSGEVLEVGEGVERFAVGDRVAVEPIRSCQTCAFCRSGKYNLCPKRILIGAYFPGALADYIAVPEYTLYRLPENVDFELGALAEPLAVCVHGLHIVRLTAGERVLVLGSGTIGLFSVLAAKHFGASEITATYRHEHQGEAALAMGASRIVKDTEVGSVKRHDIDVVVETVGGSAPTLTEAMNSVRYGGRISVLGLFTQPQQVDALSLMRNEITMAGGITYCRPGQQSDFDVALGILSSDPERARRVITHRTSLDEAAKAFATAADKRQGSLKVHIQV
ncbi:MAG TPA: alcohol dehydrogenase catalytic domain-containing protein [Dehalococcoidia bacterium]|nr:alcohol dehydrogenase catalytic domain-containing protein [Dehalococcoidia bacterium]